MEDYNQDDHGYILGRNHISACRLNLQHYLWREAIGFAIEPSIRVPKQAAIADVACGTGLWLLEVSKLYPEAQLHGFDLDLAQAPHTEWLPANILLDKWDIFENIDPAWEAKFDLIHVRLLILALTGETTPPFIEKLLKLLKPGGYLQWDELDLANMHIRKVDPSISSPALDEIYNLCYSGGRNNWPLQIPAMLAQKGFEGSKLTKVGDESHLVRAFQDQHLLTMDEIAAGMIKVGKVDAGKNLFGLIEKASREAVTGAALCIPRVVVVARKPL